MTPNEGRAKLNLPPKPGGDDLITQSNQAPLQLLEQMNTAPIRSRPQIRQRKAKQSSTGSPSKK
jgi:hypothetical protein